MGQFDALINAANRALDNTDLLLNNPNTPFNVMYKQYKVLQSLWFRVVEDASDSNSKKLESLCVELEEYVQACESWIDENSPTKKQDEALERETEINE
jgi:hypothetical protein